MKQNSPSRWTTASFGNPADTSPIELASLGDHLDLCQNTRGRMYRLRCAAESMNGFVSARFFTTLVVASVFIGVCALVT